MNQHRKHAFMLELYDRPSIILNFCIPVVKLNVAQEKNLCKYHKQFPFPLLMFFLYELLVHDLFRAYDLYLIKLYSIYIV